MKIIFKFIIAAGAYYIFGRMALFFALPPGYASPIWPSSGIALAFILVYGYRYWPAILIGSFILNFPTSLDALHVSTNIVPITTALIIGLGASLQSVFGAWLIRKFLSTQPTLTKLKEIFLFFVYGGLLSCIISPTIGVSTLIIGRGISWDEGTTHWLIWWMGDVLGVFLFASLALTWLSREKKNMDHAKNPVNYIFCIGDRGYALPFVFWPRSSKQESAAQTSNTRNPDQISIGEKILSI